MDWWEEDLEEGRFGDYRIEKKLGEGGMAEVFLAVGLPSGVHRGRSVAIKVPKLSQVAPASLKYLLARFEKEVLLQSQEPIPGVVTMLGAGEMRDRGGVARPYLVMEYLTGGTLADRLGSHEPLLENRRARPQTLEEVLEWLPSIARTLDALHRCTPQRLHRDVKPENILFNRAGDPFLSDFGIATLLDEEGSGSLHGSQATVPGSPGYQAPETYAGDKMAASDQFGLGVTVYEALAGHLPVKVRTAADYIRQTANWNPTSLQMHCPALLKAAVQAVMQAIAGDPGQRHVNCMTFARVLHRAAGNAAQGSDAGAAVPPSPPPAAPQPQLASVQAAASSSQRVSPPSPPPPPPPSKAQTAREPKPRIDVAESKDEASGKVARGILPVATLMGHDRKLDRFVIAAWLLACPILVVILSILVGIYDRHSGTGGYVLLAVFLVTHLVGAFFIVLYMEATLFIRILLAAGYVFAGLILIIFASIFTGCMWVVKCHDIGVLETIVGFLVLDIAAAVVGFIIWRVVRAPSEARSLSTPSVIEVPPLFGVR